MCRTGRTVAKRIPRRSYMCVCRSKALWRPKKRAAAACSDLDLLPGIYSLHPTSINAPRLRVDGIFGRSALSCSFCASVAFFGLTSPVCNAGHAILVLLENRAIMHRHNRSHATLSFHLPSFAAVRAQTNEARNGFGKRTLARSDSRSPLGLVYGP